MRINVVVKPLSGKQEIVKKSDHWVVFLKSPAQDNKANIELVKLLRKKTKKVCRIVSGLTSKKKVVKLE